MLTVLIRYTKSKTEVLFPALSVEYDPERGLLIHKSDTESTQLGFTLNADSPDKDYREAFIMNANGATVARYTL